MVHIPTDAYGDSFGYAFAEFETDAIAKAVCRKAKATGVSPGAIAVTMRSEWEKKQEELHHRGPGAPRKERDDTNPFLLVHTRPTYLYITLTLTLTGGQHAEKEPQGQSPAVGRQGQGEEKRGETQGEKGGARQVGHLEARLTLTLTLTLTPTPIAT